MYISPIKAIESGWIQGDITKEMVQPNGIDFTIDRLFKVSSEGDFFQLLKDEKEHREWEEMNTSHLWLHKEMRSVFVIHSRTSYDFQSDLRVNIPRDIVANLIVRSTLNRNQIFITSGLYDSGFNGNISGIMHNLGGQAIIERGSRIGQIVFAEAQAASVYNGSYQNLTGHWTGK